MPIGKSFGVYSSGALLGVQRQQLDTGINLPKLAKSLDASYDWGGENLPAIGEATGNWIDSIGGVVATASGTPTVGTINGQKAVSFDGTSKFTTAAFSVAISPPYVVVLAVLPQGSAPLFDGIVTGNRCQHLWPDATTFRVVNAAGANVANWAGVRSVAQITRTLINGASSEHWRNGASQGIQTLGAATLTGATIGGSFFGNGANGSVIANTTIFAARPSVGDATAQLVDLNTRATAFALACQQKYQIT